MEHTLSLFRVQTPLCLANISISDMGQGEKMGQSTVWHYIRGKRKSTDTNKCTTVLVLGHTIVFLAPRLVYF